MSQIGGLPYGVNNRLFLNQSAVRGLFRV